MAIVLRDNVTMSKAEYDALVEDSVELGDYRYAARKVRDKFPTTDPCEHDHAFAQAMLERKLMRELNAG